MPWYLWVGFDLAYLLLLLLVVGLPLATVGGLAAGLACAVELKLLLAPVWLLLFLAGMALVMLVLNLALPRPVPGRYPFPGHVQSISWLVRFALQRIVNLPLWGPLIFGFATVRFALLRAAGAQVAFDMQTSSDVMLTDPALTTVGKGSMLAARTFLACHLIEHGELLLAPVVLGEGVQLMGEVTLAPGVQVGANTVLGPGTKVLPMVRLGADVFVGMGCVLYNDCQVGANTVIGHHATLEQGVVVGEGAVIQAWARVPKGTRLKDGDIFPPRSGASR